jgi:hypothetical protein
MELFPFESDLNFETLSTADRPMAAIRTRRRGDAGSSTKSKEIKGK